MSALSAEIQCWWRVTTQIWGSASDWLRQTSLAARPIRSTTQICVLTRHQYRISTFVPQRSFREQTSAGIAKCWLFSQGVPLTHTCDRVFFYILLTINFSSCTFSQAHSLKCHPSFCPIPQVASPVGGVGWRDEWHFRLPGPTAQYETFWDRDCSTIVSFLVALCFGNVIKLCGCKAYYF